MKTKSLLASLAVASLALAQPLAAATRSSDSLPSQGVQSTSAAERAGSIGTEAEAIRGQPILLIVLLFGVLAALLAVSSGGKSPG